MKRVKRIASLVLAMVMVFAMSVTAFATNTPATGKDNEHKIVITNTKDNHQYTAYQIFAGNLYTKEGVKTLTDVTWGSGIKKDAVGALLATLQSDDTFLVDVTDENGVTKKVNAFAGIVNDDKAAAAVAKALSDSKFSDAANDKFAEIIGTVENGADKYLAASTSTSTKTGTEPEFVYTIPVTGDGYYFVKDTGTIANGDAATRYILQVVADVNVAAKADAPSLGKTTVEDVKTTTYVCGNTEEGHDHSLACLKYAEKANNGAIGDKVPFKLSSNVPKMDGYEKYYFVIEDTMDKGLTFNDDVEITIGGQKLTACNETIHVHDPKTENTYYVKKSTVEGEKTKIEIVFENFIQYKSNPGAEIVVNYSATINAKANIGTTGNKNEANLIYSNNPNTTDDGDKDHPDYPGPDSPTGKTPEEQTFTYVTALQLTKVDESGKALTGAEFEIEATPFNKILVQKTAFVARAEGETEGDIYYLLTDGKYTTTAPVFDNDETKDTSKYYDNLNEDKTAVTVTYKLVTTETEETVPGETKKYKAYVDENGILSIKGLSAGTYIIEETIAPNGYNKLTDKITVELKWTKPVQGSTQCKWEAKKDNGKWEDYSNNQSKAYEFSIENKKGSQLPSTGGIGTTIFYVVGGILVIGAGILLVTKRRMKTQ